MPRITFAAGFLLAGICSSCATVPAPSPAQALSDQETTNRVLLALNDDPTYYFRHVDVHVSDGVTELSGYVWSTQAIYRAREISNAVPGVMRVVTSHLELERQGRGVGISR
jgi:osmotically-inducible protein OsmY